MSRGIDGQTKIRTQTMAPRSNSVYVAAVTEFENSKAKVILGLDSRT